MSPIYHRVSIRKYLDKPVDDELIRDVLKAGMQAPSASNQQPWEFYVTHDHEKMMALSEVSPYAKMLKNAPCAIVSAYRKNCRLPDYAEIDLSIAMENMWLRCDELGLGAVWLGIAPIEERMKGCEEICEIDENLRAFGILVIGWPAEEKKQQDRFEESRIHIF